MVLGALGKASIRFLCYDQIKAYFAGPSGKVSLAGGILAGMCAGTAESLIALTPTERIKTALIDDARGARRFRGGFHAVSTVLRERGLPEIYRGCTATTIKQAATSGVRMGSYNILKQWTTSVGLPNSTTVTFGVGAVAGVITVYATQPFDTIKTRTQAAAGARTIDAYRSILQDAGVKGLWSGSTTRLSRLILSGGIIFTVYEELSTLLNSRLARDTPLM
jgi:solute carrier family 25 citrate transporter 1